MNTRVPDDAPPTTRQSPAVGGGAWPGWRRAGGRYASFLITILRNAAAEGTGGGDRAAQEWASIVKISTQINGREDEEVLRALLAGKWKKPLCCDWHGAGVGADPGVISQAWLVSGLRVSGQANGAGPVVRRPVDKKNWGNRKTDEAGLSSGTGAPGTLMIRLAMMAGAREWSLEKPQFNAPFGADEQESYA